MDFLTELTELLEDGCAAVGETAAETVPGTVDEKQQAIRLVDKNVRSAVATAHGVAGGIESNSMRGFLAIPAHPAWFRAPS